MLIFARHGETPSIELQKAGSPESRIQGVGETMPLSDYGETQSFALGYAVGEFVSSNSLQVTTVDTPDVLRAIQTRDRLLSVAGFDPAPDLNSPDKRLRNMDKGNLQGMLRSEAYPTEEIRYRQAHDWHFRHGTLESGGETAYEAGRRWLDWFRDEAQLAEENGNQNEALLIVGCNFVTAFGTWMLTHPNQDTPGSLPDLKHVTENYKLDNGTAIVVEGEGDEWEITERIIPDDEHFAQVETMSANSRVALAS